MTRHPVRRWWLGLVGLAWALAPADAQAWGTPIPVHVDSIFVYRFDVKVGHAAFIRPAAPWYTYFPADPHLLAQPTRGAFPNWPTQFPAAPAPVAPPPAQAAPVAPLGYFQAPTGPSVYDVRPGVRPISFYTP